MIVVNSISNGKKVYHLEGRLNLKAESTFTVDLGVPIQQYCVAGNYGSGIYVVKSSYHSMENYPNTSPTIEIQGSKITLTNKASMSWTLVYWLLG